MVVPIPIQLFRKTEFETVDVDRSDPTVSCDVVAIKFAPVASETKMELAGYDV